MKTRHWICVWAGCLALGFFLGWFDLLAQPMRVINRLEDIPNVRVAPTAPVGHTLVLRTNANGTRYWTNAPGGSAGGVGGAGRGLVLSGTNLHYAQASDYTVGVIPYAASGTTMSFIPELSWDPALKILTLNSAAGSVAVLNLASNGTVYANIATDGSGSFRVFSGLTGFFSDGGVQQPSAILEANATDKGFLIPRMTTGQRDAISSPATGLLIFNTTTGTINAYDGAAWGAIGGGGAAGVTNYFDYTFITNNIFISGKGNTAVISNNITIYGNMTFPWLENGSTVIDWATNSHWFTLASSPTFTFDHATNNNGVYVALEQNNTGGFIPVWPSGIVWPNTSASTALDPATNANAVTFYSFKRRNGTNYCDGYVSRAIVSTGGSQGFVSGGGSVGKNAEWSSTTVLTDGILSRTGTNQTVAGNLIVAGNHSTRHVIGTSTAPTIAAGAGAGTGPTVAIAGTDMAGQITVTSGTLPSVSAVICTVTFNAAYGTAPYVVLWPANANASVLTFLPYAGSTTTTFTVNAGTVALGGSTEYRYNYHVMQ